MIVANVSDARIRAALLDAAHPEEEVVWDPGLILEAVERGYPRLFVETEAARHSLADLVRDVPVVQLSESETSRPLRGGSAAEGRARLAEYLREVVEQRADAVSWVDRTLAELTRAAGRPLPPALRAFARHVLEFPSFYDDLHPVAERCGTSRGALKARFRRRGLPSPYSYLRWMRIMACANVLSDRNVTVAQTAHRLGYTSDGNLCRTMSQLTGFTPTEVRTPQGRSRLLMAFHQKHLQPDAVEGWNDLADLFLYQVA